MTHLIGPRVGRGGLGIATFALAGILLLHPDPASAQGCDRGVFSTSAGNLIGSAVGGATGGLIGNQFGKGTGKGVMTGVGVVGGALAGGYVGRQVEGCGDAPRRAEPQATRGGAQHTAAAPARGAVASDPRTCRFVPSQTVIDGREQQVEVIACLDADGVWRAASGVGAERAAEADLVLRAQQRLREQGFYVRDNIDGKWGPATASAVNNFQRANGLAASGRLDAPTRTALGLDAAPAAPAAAVPVAQSGASASAGIAQRTE